MEFIKTYYNLILWGVLVLFLVGSGWYVKGKLDENTTMKNKITQLEIQASDLKELQNKYNDLDKKLTTLNSQRSQSFTKTDKGAANAFKTTEFSSTHLTPMQLCYWNDFGDEQTTTTCLSNAGVSTSPNPTTK